MKKKYLRYPIIVVLLVMVIISGLTCASAGHQSNADASVNAYSALFDALCVFNEGKDSFDEWFAGGMLNDNGTLTLFIKADSSDQLKYVYDSYCEMVPALRNVSLPVCVTYSLNDLLSFQELTIQAFKEANIISCGINYQANMLYIGCHETSPLFDSYDLKIPEDSYSLFVENEGLTLTSLHGGDETTGTTLGWCGTYNGGPAVVSCAHGNHFFNTLTITDEANNVSVNATRVFDSITDLSGTSRLGDFYIATVGSGLTTNNTHTGSSGTLVSCGSYLSSLPLESDISLYGKVSKGFIGKTKLYYTCYVETSKLIEGDIIYGLVLADPDEDNCITPVPGDSGGPVYYTYQSGGIGATGTITGTNENMLILFSPLKYAADYGFVVRTW